MAAMPWVKLYTEILDDVKLARLTEAQRWRFVQLLALAGECDAAGALISGDEPMSVEDMAWRLRVDPAVMITDIEKLVAVGLLTSKEGVYYVTKFSDRQGPSQAEKRDEWVARQQRKRDRVKGVTGESPVTHADVTPMSPVTHADVTLLEEEREREREREEEREEESAAASGDCGSTDVFDQTVAMAERLIGLPVIQGDINVMREWANYSLEENEIAIRAALAWRRSQGLKPITRIGQLAGSVKTERAARLQAANAKSNGTQSPTIDLSGYTYVGSSK